MLRKVVNIRRLLTLSRRVSLFMFDGLFVLLGICLHLCFARVWLGGLGEHLIPCPVYT